MTFDSSGPSPTPAGPDDAPGGTTEAHKRQTFIRLVFGDDEARFAAFRQAIVDAVPAGTRAVVRGSAITGVRWKDQAPFDADGPGTSDVDLTLVGADVLAAYNLSGFYVPGVHTRPMGEEDPDIAPALKDLREHLTSLARRPVNVQASRDWVLYLRGELIGQPYLTIVGDEELPA